MRRCAAGTIVGVEAGQCAIRLAAGGAIAGSFRGDLGFDRIAGHFDENKTMTDEDQDTDIAPPWQVFPEITPEDISVHMRQGRAEPYFDAVWRPFWASLSEAQRSAYLDRWNASPAWRATTSDFNVGTDFDPDKDARESEVYLADMRRQREEKPGVSCRCRSAGSLAGRPTAQPRVRP